MNTKLMCLNDLMVLQDAHNHAFHPDIYALPPAQQLRHFALHYGKYAGRFAALEREQTFFADPRSIRTVVDGMLITLSALNVFSRPPFWSVDRYLLTPLSELMRGRLESGTPTFVYPQQREPTLFGLAVLRLSLLNQPLFKWCDDFEHTGQADLPAIYPAFRQQLFFWLWCTQVAQINLAIAVLEKHDQIAQMHKQKT